MVSEDSGKEGTLVETLSSIFSKGKVIDGGTTDKLEEVLMSADIGVRVTHSILSEIQKKYKGKTIDSEDDILKAIKDHMVCALDGGSREILTAGDGIPTVVLVVGINGTGKTTSIGKLANLYIKQGKKVILGAGDTFRAGAGEQIKQWAERVGTDIVLHKQGGDPAAVIFDTLEAGIARGADYILLDTAGRLHTKDDLMKQLEKINRVIMKKIPDAPHEVLLVLDATLGQNGLAQAKRFYEDVGVTGIFLAKMDGTAKGGIIFSIKKELDIPVKFIGTGEQAEDIKEFDPKQFVERIFFSDGLESFDCEIDRSLEQKMSKKRGKKHTRKLFIFLLMILLIVLVLFFVFNKRIWYEFLKDILQYSHLKEFFD